MMRKFFKTTLSLALLTAMTLCFSSCLLTAKDKIKKIAPEVDYDFVLTFGETIVINGTHYELEDLAYDVLGKKSTDEPVLTNAKVVGKYIYFLYTYASSNPFFPKDTNNRKFDVALFKANVETAETTVLYDFKGARPMGLTSKYPNVCSFIDDKSIFIFYNGDLMLFDIRTETITQTIPFYDEMRAISKGFSMETIQVGEIYCDKYYYAGDGIARYAEYRDGKIVDHTFKIDEDCIYHNDDDAERFLRLERAENYVYDYKYVNGQVKFFNCFDLISGEDLGGEFAENFLKEKKEEREQREREESARRESEEASEAEEEDDRDVVSLNGKDYYYRFERSSVEIEDKEGNTLYSVDSDYAQERSKKFTELFRLYFDGVWAEIAGVKSYKNRLFISFRRSILMWGSTPRMVFEFNLETGEMSYLTYTNPYIGYSIYSITPKKQ